MKMLSFLTASAQVRVLREGQTAVPSQNYAVVSGCDDSDVINQVGLLCASRSAPVLHREMTVSVLQSFGSPQFYRVILEVVPPSVCS